MTAPTPYVSFESRMFCNFPSMEACRALAARLGPPTETLASRDTVYMERWILSRLADGGTIRLHHFLRGDLDEEHHDHPWNATAHLLYGSYREERLIEEPGGGRRVESSVYRAGQVNEIRATTYHRITLCSDEVWSFFITGPKAKSWSFKHPTTGLVTPWREFVAAREAAEGAAT